MGVDSRVIFSYFKYSVNLSRQKGNEFWESGGVKRLASIQRSTALKSTANAIGMKVLVGFDERDKFASKLCFVDMNIYIVRNVAL